MENELNIMSQEAQKVKLSVTEKTTMRGFLAEYASLHPRILVRSPYAHIFSPVRKNSFRNNKTLPALIAIGLLMGGSVSFAAEGTTVGDVLYPVKIYVNEPVRGAMALTTDARMDWEVRLVERRLEEVEKVAANVNLSQDVLDGAQINFEKYTERVNTHIVNLEQEGKKEKALTLSGRLATRIQNHENVVREKFERAEQSDIYARPALMAEAPFSGDVSREDSLRDVRREKTMERIRDVRVRAEKRNQEIRGTFEEERDSFRD